MNTLIRPARKTSTPAPSPRARIRSGRIAGRLALELLVVFVGVYTAFALSEYRQARSAEERRAQLQMALVREIQDITANTRRAAATTPIMVARLDSLIAAGARPSLPPMIEPIRVQNHMWEATLQSGGIDLFDVPTVYALSRFYNGLNAGFEQLEQLRSLSETILIPNLDRGPGEFYDPQSGALRPKYRWYRSGLERVGHIAAEVTALGDTLVAQLQTAPPDAGAPAS